MALDMTPEQKAIGRANFQRAVGKLAEAPTVGEGVTRRRFMQGLVAAGATMPVAAAAYFGYSNSAFTGRPVKAALIGAGDEGGVLVGEHNPAYLEFVAFSDIRPSNFRERIFKAEPAPSPRRGFNFHYGNNARDIIRHHVDYREILSNPDIEAVVIALPLHLHAKVAMEAMDAGKHVLCEKLMAWNITQCKAMIRKAEETNRILSIGHQRHYSMLYAHATAVIKSGVLGDVTHIRALWHRNNARPVMDGNQPKTERMGNGRIPVYRDSWRKDVTSEDKEFLRGRDLRQFGYKDINELVRWRLFRRTGGGLMAELGSHQLDACSIFLGKVRPIAVTAVGGKNFYQDEREVEDSVFCTFEFPAPGYDANRPNYDRDRHAFNQRKVVTVTYSSINTNSFEPYGECVMGSEGTLVLEGEQNVMLWGGGGRSTAVTVTTGGGRRPAIDSSASTDGPGERQAAASGQNALGHGPPSRGYREEMEHFAYCIRMRDQGMERDRADLKPRCGGEAAMADAIIALTANQAIRRQQRIEFQNAWFDPRSAEVPDSDMVEERL